MEHWQFLIQRQGDRSWHTLESPNLEISEGRYRVLARSNLPNTDVEVRVTHSSTQEVPPKRRIQRRSRRTNSEGLMAVIPFTHLKPGIWQLRCSGDLMSDILGKSWQCGIQLQVVSQPADEVIVEQLGVGENGESNSLDYPDSVADGNLESNVLAEPVVITQGNSDSNESVESNSRDRSDSVADAMGSSVLAESASTTEKNSVNELIDKTAPVVFIQNNSDSNDLPIEKEEEASDQPVSPVWFKGETTEQILQNLIDLALPVSESLLEDEKVENFSVTQPLSPLRLILDRETYIARWGQALTISGRVELQDQTNLLNQGLNPVSFHNLELRIELRSPLGSEILTQVQQSLPNQLLPFTINSAIDIPANCESKLILADVSLYGALTNVSEVMLLASQSFTITADVTELLAIAAAKSNQSELLDNSSSSPTSTDTKEPEISVSLDLKLFNLVKASQANPSLLIPLSLNKSLTPQTNSQFLQATSFQVLKLNKSGDLRSPQLPKLPENQTNVISTDAVEDFTSVQEPNQDNVTLPADPINLEQLVIKNHRIPFLSNNFPYLKRLTASLRNNEEVKSNTPELSASEDSLEVDTSCEHENILDSVVDEEQLQDDSTAEIVISSNLTPIDDSVAEVVVPSSSEVRSSPLIKKWMQSQGYSLPESIDLQYQYKNTDVTDLQPILQQQTPPSASSPTPVVDANLSLDNLELETEMKEVAEVEEIGIQEDADMEVEEIGIQENTYTENTLEAASVIQTQPAWLAREIVVDDIYSEPEVDTQRSYSFEDKEQAFSDLSESPPLSIENTEPLPIPQLHVPEGELIAGKSVRISVQLPNVSPQVVIKLWVEDCQTRWLLDGPHLLKDLLPSSAGGLEAMTQLNVPFGCLEIRIEAIAFDLTSQQESHKVTEVRTVIPPDLPNLRLDELLGMDM